MAAPLHFADVDGNAAFAQVSREGEDVRLVVSIETDGDYDVLLPTTVAIDLAHALRAAAGSAA